MTAGSLDAKIAEIPGGDGWWKGSSEATYERAARTLVEAGFTEDAAVDMLSNLYWAAAACYGQ